MRYNIHRTELIMQAEFKKCGMLRAYKVLVYCIGGEDFTMIVRLPESIDAFRAKKIAENLAIDCVFYETELITNYAEIEDIGSDGTYDEFIQIISLGEM